MIRRIDILFAEAYDAGATMRRLPIREAANSE